MIEEKVRSRVRDVGDKSRFDLPVIEGDTAEWWGAVRKGHLLIELCQSCGDRHLYPRGFCSACWSDDVTWREASGRGTLYTYSVVRVNDLPPFNERLPYVVAMVELEEGPRLMSTVTGVALDELKIGMALQFRPEALTDEISAPVFEVAAR